MRNRVFVLATALCISASASPARADEPFQLCRSATFQWENDFLARIGTKNRDEHYTNGVRVSCLSDELGSRGASTGAAWDAMDHVFRVLPGQGERIAQRIGVSIGQSLYTPDDTDRGDPIRDDRPYAGWLYAGLSLHETYSKEGKLDHQDVVQLQLGLVGPHTYGEFAQNEFHDLIGVDGANGWHHQIRDEVGVNLILERKWRRNSDWLDRVTGLDTDVIPHLGASLGNVMTYGAAGGLVRVGHNLGQDFGPPRIQPGVPGSETLGEGAAWGWYLFLGVEGRIVARNIFLDGNTFRDSLSVDRRWLGGDLQAGFAFLMGNARLSYTHVLRISEFAEQDKADQFGALSLTLGF